MKIIHVIPSLSSGGAQRITVDICNKLSEDHDVHLIQLSRNNDEKSGFYKNQISKRVKYLTISGKDKKKFDFRVIYNLIIILNQIKPNIVHAHLNISYLLVVSILFRSTKYFYTIHTVAETDCLKIKGFSFKSIIKLYFKKRFIKPVTVSKNSMQSYNEFYNLDNSIMIENGCNQKVKSEKFRSVQREISKYKSDAEDLIFLHIGRFHLIKNQNMLVRVFNRLIKENEKVKLLIIGEGFDSELGLKLQKKAVGGVYFLGVKENVSDYLYCSNAFCLSSLKEGMPITLLESISVGCIPLCTPAGGIPNVIFDETIGYISKDFSEDEYYSMIKKFIKQGHLINKETLKNIFVQKYSINSTVSKLLNVYK